MHVCYLDEAGDTRALPKKKAEPTLPRVFVFGGISVNAREIHEMNLKMLGVKSSYLNDKAIKTMPLPPEIKGAALRKQIGQPKVTEALDSVFEIFREHDVKILARIYVKTPGSNSKGEALYNRAVQLSCARFHDRLEAIDHHGLVVADSRDPKSNEAAAHSISSEKLRGTKDKLPRIAELPTFGQSQNHIGLQLADIVCSALVFPIAIASYIGAKNGHQEFAQHFAPKLKEFQDRYVDDPAKQVAGISVFDLNGKPLSPAKLFA